MRRNGSLPILHSGFFSHDLWQGVWLGGFVFLSFGSFCFYIALAFTSLLLDDNEREETIIRETKREEARTERKDEREESNIARKDRRGKDESVEKRESNPTARDLLTLYPYSSDRCDLKSTQTYVKRKRIKKISMTRRRNNIRIDKVASRSLSVVECFE